MAPYIVLFPLTTSNSFHLFDQMSNVQQKNTNDATWKPRQKEREKKLETITH